MTSTKPEVFVATSYGRLIPAKVIQMTSKAASLTGINDTHVGKSYSPHSRHIPLLRKWFPRYRKSASPEVTLDTNLIVMADDPNWMLSTDGRATNHRRRHSRSASLVDNCNTTTPNNTDDDDISSSQQDHRRKYARCSLVLDLPRDNCLHHQPSNGGSRRRRSSSSSSVGHILVHLKEADHLPPDLIAKVVSRDIACQTAATTTTTCDLTSNHSTIVTTTNTATPATPTTPNGVIGSDLPGKRRAPPPPRCTKQRCHLVTRINNNNNNNKIMNVDRSSRSSNVDKPNRSIDTITNRVLIPCTDLDVIRYI